MKHLVLIGFMASGKSTLASLLSASLKLPIFSSDTWIENQSGISIAEIFFLYGESEFREWERKAFRQAMSLEESHIIDCGGGFVVQNDVRELGRVYYLQVELEEIERRLRIKEESSKRPLANQIKSLYEIREKIYQAQADRIIRSETRLEEIIEDWRRS